MAINLGNYMKILLILISVILFSDLVAGCYKRTDIALVVPPHGMLYTNIKAPFDINFNNTRISHSNGNGDGERTVYFKEPIFSSSYGMKDASIKNAAGTAGLKQIDYIDYEYVNILGIFMSFKIIPHGVKAD